MNTQALIERLASDTRPAPAPARLQLARAGLLGGLVGILLLLTLWGINPQMRAMAVHPAFLTKMVWLAGLIAFSVHGLLRLSRPGLSAGQTWKGLALCLLAMWGLGVAQSWQAQADARLALWLGASWPVCSVSIAALALPVLAALFWALRQLAPTNPALAGAVAGVLASSLAACLYSLHCPETSFGFFALWYVAGMAAVTALGAALGQRLLRW
ncbi:MAG: hypothetical protein RL559_1291 [Pseudomonadota bacterium]|jgi:hypothetical protein